MCLVVFAWQCHPDYRLLVAANRDEMHARPSAAMDWWPDQQGLLAGRDLQAGGTWLGVSRDGRFSTVTNYRERFRSVRGKKSRGELVCSFLTGDRSPSDYSATLDGDAYAGFCLLTANRDELCYVSNRGDPPRLLPPGVYGLSNAAVDTPWPKLLRTRTALKALIDDDEVNPSALQRIMHDTTPAPVKDLDDHLPVELARAVSAPFIKNERYGTRCTSIVMLGTDGRAFVSERQFDSAGHQVNDVQFRFKSATAVDGS